jgi:hypothetical protein
LYWLQQSKANKLIHGDNNTKYFQLLANGRHRKTRIFQLEQDEGIIVGEDNIKTNITNYYKTLFRELESDHFKLNECLIDDIPQVSDLENEILSDTFSEKYVKEAIFEIEHNKAPSPDGFLAEFYQQFWEIIKPELMALFQEFHNGTLPLHSLNFGVITLLSKKRRRLKLNNTDPFAS